MEACPCRGLREWGFAPPSADGSPAGRLFEKSPLHPAKTFTLAAKAEGQVVFQSTPSSRRATLQAPLWEYGTVISIHALLTEGYQ